MNKPKQSLWKRVKAEKVSYLMLLPNVILFTAFTVYPLLWVLRYMFFDYRGYGEPVFVGLENFARVTRDEVFWTAVKNTFVYVFGKLILTIPFAFLTWPSTKCAFIRKCAFSIISVGNLPSLFSMSCIILTEFCPAKIGRPRYISAIIAPVDHTSIGKLDLMSNTTSGAL